ncbi:ATP/GTP-binding protein [Streptomyces spiroverticillatus]|uniref:ATP/GTP-binding protein n=1 Tax=Streptomyces finlayi TaxID=67296 RepID=A0A919CGK4_9ACTN|nr:ATP/GTP-binding protein [Streptomyces finlayi]GHA47934.1 ATP/GTP-binding protein [Streptomyces spiroverticillatus]GHD18823.1 ATP/GTP-binding protein [Streptomyces finlayi]
MDTRSVILAQSNTLLDTAGTLVTVVAAVPGWITGNLWWLIPLAAIAAFAVEWQVRRLADKASQSRMAVELVPDDTFDPSLEQIFRYAVQLVRASGSGPWTVPRRAKAVRVRMRADGRTPLSYRIEGAAGAAQLLRTTPYAPAVTCRKAPPAKKTKAQHTVRAEFVLRGLTVAPLRDVPLEPDPLQPLADAVADLRTDLGDVAEICLDIQRAPAWHLKARRWQAMEDARTTEHREARRASSWVRRDAERAEDSVWGVLRELVGGRETRGGPRWVMPPAPRRVDADKALGKLTGTHLVRVQLLVRCSSDMEGRAKARLRQLEAALDVFGGEARWQMRGFRLGPWHYSSDRSPARKSFDRRWATGQVRAPRSNWVALGELAGMLKPPTRHCRLPLLATAVPTWVPGNRDLVLQGWHRSGDGQRRMVATREDETLFEVAVGKSGWGKTERALCQAVGLARAGRGLLFVDPHGDSWHRAAPYLAVEEVAGRIARIDLAATSPQARSGCWNPLGMDQGQEAHQVIAQSVDAFAAALGWNAVSAPRALTIFTKAVEALVTVNTQACRAQQTGAQATVFQVRALLSDAAFRESVVAVLEEEAAQWWRTSFAALPADALPVVLNPLDRLAADPVTRAFLGNPVGAYNIRAAMDAGMVVWICPAGDGPTDRLLVSLLMRDLLRAGLSRRDIPARHRVPFRTYLDELITLDGAASESLAQMQEQLRKFGIRLHGMTQLLQRLSEPVRASLLQNASTLTTTAGSMAAIRHITGEWNERVDAGAVARLPRYHHYATLPAKGERVGPLLLEGPRLEDVFGDGAKPAAVGALARAADDLAQARPRDALAEAALTHTTTVQHFLTHTSRPALTRPTSRKEYS